MSIDNGWDSIWQNGPAPTDPVHQLGDANAKIRKLEQERNGMLHSHRQYTKILDFCIGNRHWEQFPDSDDPVMSWVKLVPSLQRQINELQRENNELKHTIALLTEAEE